MTWIWKEAGIVNWRYHPNHLPDENHKKTSVSIASLETEILTWGLPIMKEQ
jgi:hypothetical protein